MKCATCTNSEMSLLFTRQGVEVDQCPECKSIWLDEGEIFHFTPYPKVIARKLEAAQSLRKESQIKSPVSDTMMDTIIYDLEINISQCPDSHGLWFSRGQLKALLAREKRLQLEFTQPAKKISPGKEMTPESKEDKATPAPPLKVLPNLLTGSLYTLGGLYGLMTLILIIAVEFGDISVSFAFKIAAFLLLIQFVFSPWIMDLSLRWLYQMKFVDLEDLPESSRHFIRKLCREKKLATPRFGMINDGAPQAFTYGHVPGNARIVLSAGIFDLLDEDEVNGVIAHEIGHAVHWDMLVMTLAQLVPMVLYYIYRTMISASNGKPVGQSGGGSSSSGNLAVALGAYALYIVSEYIVLWLSRNREYHADRFAGEYTGNPSTLASALVKIAYGLAGGDHSKTEEDVRTRNSRFDAIGALGIFNANAAKRLAISGFDDDDSTLLNKDGVKHAMRWDMWNPWAKWYELHSTHPLIAKRLLALSDLSLHLGLEPFIEFDDEQPESYWDEFFLDLTILALPWIPLVIGSFLTGYSMFLGDGSNYLPLSLVLSGVAILIKAQYIYKNDFFPRSAISGLLKKVKVSAVRPVPCKVKGTVIGRGIPGYLFSEDFVIRDKTGIIFLDYRQPLAIWEFFFSILRRNKFDGQAVQIVGWYRRAPTPYIEIKELVAENGETIKSWVPMMVRMTGLLAIAGGIILGMVLSS